MDLGVEKKMNKRLYMTLYFIWTSVQSDVFETLFTFSAAFDEAAYRERLAFFPIQFDTNLQLPLEAPQLNRVGILCTAP